MTQQQIARVKREIHAFFWKAKREKLARAELYKKREMGGWGLSNMGLFAYVNYISTVWGAVTV